MLTYRNLFWMNWLESSMTEITSAKKCRIYYLDVCRNWCQLSQLHALRICEYFTVFLTHWVGFLTSSQENGKFLNKKIILSIFSNIFLDMVLHILFWFNFNAWKEENKIAGSLIMNCFARLSDSWTFILAVAYRIWEPTKWENWIVHCEGYKHDWTFQTF